MDKLLFGTAGVPHSAAKPRSTLDGIKRVAELGLGCMELEFVQRVTMSEAGARLVAQAATREGIKLSAHASYYINLNAREPEKVQASQKRLLHAARISAICGAQSVIFHPAFYLGDPPETAYQKVKTHLKEVLDTLKAEDVRITVRPEVMGKPTQFGTIEENMRLSTELEGVAPCFDFAHWHARGGAFNSYDEFAAVLQQIKDTLGKAALENIHIHFSGIEYGARGEKKHLNLKESDLKYQELLRALKDFGARGMVICESPSLEEDALLLQETYNKLR